MEKLPDDVVSNILIRLPAKLLAQMRSVSKPLNALLSQPSFIMSHLHRSIDINDEILLAYEHGITFTVHPSQSPHLELPNFIRLPADLLSLNYGCKLVGSVNGLVCFVNGGRKTSIYIWNPSLSAVITLPPYTLPYRPHNEAHTYLRFGFDPKTDDYKVVKISGLRSSRYHDPVKEWLQVELYSMRNRSWKLITERVPSHVTKFIETDEVCVDGHDGHLHWLCRIGENQKLQAIVAFDLGVESFRVIPLPTAGFWNHLGVLAGKLCVMSCALDSDCEVWVMDMYGVAASWVKHHNFSQFSYLRPFGFTLHNEFLFETYNYQLALYDPIAAKVKLFKSMPEYGEKRNIVVYVDSLVWVAPWITCFFDAT